MERYLESVIQQTYETNWKRRRGISMIEVVIALGILAFGVLAAAAAQLSSVRFNRNSRLRTEAYYLAEQQMENFKSMTSTQLTAVLAAGSYPNDPNNPIDPDPNDNQVISFNRSWTLTADTPEIGVYTIQVQVTWTDGFGVSRNVTLESLKQDS